MSRPYRTTAGITRWLARNWPRQSNHTCGFHIHTSFPPGLLGALAGRKFLDYAMGRITEWGQGTPAVRRDELFWTRVEGDNEFCRVRDNSGEQLQHNGDRYTAFNFAAWHRHKTLECRLFPMFTGGPTVAAAAVSTLLDVYSSWLAKVGVAARRSELALEEPLVVPDVREFELVTTSVVKVRESELKSTGVRVVRDCEVVCV